MVCVSGPDFCTFFWNITYLIFSSLSCVLYCGGSEAPLLYLRHGWRVSSLSLYEEDVFKFVLQAGLACKDPSYWMAWGTCHSKDSSHSRFSQNSTSSVTTQASPGFLFCIESLFYSTSPQFASLPLIYLQISYMSVNFSLMVIELWLGPRTFSGECLFSDGSTLRVLVSRVLVTFILRPPGFPKNTFVQPKPGHMGSRVRQCEFESWSLAIWASNELHWGPYYFIWKMGQ